jgi:hypothetical protein
MCHLAGCSAGPWLPGPRQRGLPYPPRSGRAMKNEPDSCGATPVPGVRARMAVQQDHRLPHRHTAPAVPPRQRHGPAGSQRTSAAPTPCAARRTCDPAPKPRGTGVWAGLRRAAEKPCPYNQRRHSVYIGIGTVVVIVIVVLVILALRR